MEKGKRNSHRTAKATKSEKKATHTQLRGKNVLDILKEDFYKCFLLSTITRYTFPYILTTVSASSLLLTQLQRHPFKKENSE